MSPRAPLDRLGWLEYRATVADHDPALGEPSLAIEEDLLRVRSARGLELEATAVADDAVFRRFHEDYDRAFVLPNEKEDASGFARCLELNHGDHYADLALRFGPFRELCVVARTRAGEAPMGGANFIASPARVPLAGRPVVAANLNYVFVNPDWRGRGLFRPLVESVEDLIRRLFRWSTAAESSPSPLVLIFIEQNDPFRMSAEDYRRDTEHSGLDQLDRLRIWTRLGAQVVDFPYVQPALSEDQGPDPNLAYSVLGAPSKSLEAGILRRHLQVFFGVSVLKGQPLGARSEVERQLEELSERQARREPVALLDAAPLLGRLTPEHFTRSSSGAESLRAAIRELGNGLDA